jgi:hypothetical protein
MYAGQTEQSRGRIWARGCAVRGLRSPPEPYARSTQEVGRLSGPTAAGGRPRHDLDELPALVIDEVSTAVLIDEPVLVEPAGHGAAGEGRPNPEQPPDHQDDDRPPQAGRAGSAAAAFHRGEPVMRRRHPARRRWLRGREPRSVMGRGVPRTSRRGARGSAWVADEGAVLAK